MHFKNVVVDLVWKREVIFHVVLSRFPCGLGTSALLINRKTGRFVAGAKHELNRAIMLRRLRIAAEIGVK